MTPPVDGEASSPSGLPNSGLHRMRLAKWLQTERSCDVDREAMLAALRVALGLPRALPGHEGTGAWRR